MNAVVPRDRLLDTAIDLAERIAANGPLAVRAILQSARETDGLPLADALERAGAIGRPVFQTQDAAEGAKAFIEKRTPVYQGR